MPDRPIRSEIESLNRPFLSFDLGEIRAEELERRLELALAHLPVTPEACSGLACGTFACAGFTPT